MHNGEEENKISDEIRFTVDLVCENGLSKNLFRLSGVQIDQAAVGAHDTIVTVGTSSESLLIGDISTAGICVLYNLDQTNYVTWGMLNSTQQTVGRLKPNDVPAVFRVEPGTTLRATANTASCKVRFILLEN